MQRAGLLVVRAQGEWLGRAVSSVQVRVLMCYGGDGGGGVGRKAVKGWLAAAQKCQQAVMVTGGLKKHVKEGFNLTTALPGLAGVKVWSKSGAGTRCVDLLRCRGRYLGYFGYTMSGTAWLIVMVGWLSVAGGVCCSVAEWVQPGVVSDPDHGRLAMCEDKCGLNNYGRAVMGDACLPFRVESGLEMLRAVARDAMGPEARGVLFVTGYRGSLSMPHEVSGQWVGWLGEWVVML